MSDVPSVPPGQEHPEAYVPSGQRRSTFSPPPEGTPPPVWDDDALAAAMEEEVRLYTSPISLPMLAPESAPPPEPASPPQPAVQPEAAQPEPAVQPEPEPEPARHAEPEPDHIAVDPFTDPEPADDEQFARELEAAPTLDAMQRLEEELRRRGATGETEIVAPVPSFFPGAPPVSPEPPGPDPLLSTEPAPEPEPVTAESESEAAHAPVVEPALGTSPESPPSSEPDRDPLSAAPPPLYTPPPLVEPPAPPASPEPVARLLPPPTDLPDIAFRAELPPPPGYAEDGTPSPAEPPESGSADAAAPVALDPDPAPAPAPETLLPEAAEPAAASPGWDHLLAMVPEPTTPAAVAPEPLTPTPAWAPAAEPTTTEAPTPRAPAAGDVDDDDDVIDPADRVGPSPVIPLPVEGVAMAAGSPPAPSPPPTAAPTTAGVAAGATEEREPRLPRALAVETAGIEPTPREQRAGRAARLFWLWFAANASLVSVALGAVMLGTGMSLRQAIVATVVGIALSFIPLGFTTLAGKRSSQPTLVVSRSAFGTDGNLLPTILAILVRVFWGGVLLWMLGDALGRTLVPADADAGLGATRWALIGAAVGLLLTALVAAIGYGLLARVQLILSILTGLLIVGAAAVTLPKVHLDVALTRQDGPWLLIIGGAVLVFAFVGLVWAFSGSDLARYQRASASGASSMLWATFGATIPPFLLIVWGALLAASNPALATAFAAHPLSSIAGLLPSWYAAPLFVAAAVGLLSGSVLTLYSGGFALQNLTPQVPRVVGVVVAALLAFATAAGLVLLGADTRTVVHDLAVTLAVPVAGWAGIFAAEIMIRNRGFHTPSLLASGGIYPRVRWVNFIGLIVIAVVGYGFVSGGATWLGWEGFGWRLLGVGASEPLAGVDLGVLLALVLGILLPLVSAVPTIRRQEAAMDDGVAIART